MYQPFGFFASQEADLPAIEQSGLLRWFDADYSANSTTWVDLTGTQDASVDGTVTHNSLASASYYSFPGGAGNEIGQTASADMQISQSLVQMMIRTTDTANTNYAIASMRATTSGTGTRYSFHCNPGNSKLGVYNGVNFDSNTISPSIPTDNTWLWVEFLSTSITLTDFFRDGVPKTNVPRGINTGGGTRPFGIGTPNYGLTTFGNENFIGDIAVCLVYDTGTRTAGMSNNFNVLKSRFGL